MPKKPKSGDRGIFERPVGSGVYWIRYRVDGRDRRERVGLRSLARTVLAKRQAEIAENRFFPPQRVVRVREAIEDNLTRTSGHKDFAHRAALGRYWSETLGTRPLREVTPGEIERAISRLRHGRTPATVNRYLAYIRRVFSQAVEDDLVDRNPVLRVKATKENNARVRYLTPEEEAALVRVMAPEDMALVRLAIHTGLRRGEQWRLRWSDIGLDGRTIRVQEAKSGVGRWVPLNSQARLALDVLRASQGKSQERICPWTASGFVRRRWERAKKSAGISDFRWHDLRHTFASRLAMAGTPLHTIQKLLGHSTIEMTMRYAHLSPSHLHDAVSVLDEPGMAPGTAPKTNGRFSRVEGA